LSSRRPQVASNRQALGNCFDNYMIDVIVAPTEAISSPWRKFLRFSVRGLIVLVLVFGAGLGWVVRSAKVQREAVAAIKNAQGSVTYDWERHNGKSILGARPWAPGWLVDLIGVDYFGHVTGVGIWSTSPATDAAIAHVGKLSRIEQLGLPSSTTDDDCLAQLTGLTELTHLDLSGTQVTDAGLVHLRGLSKLSYLSLADTHVSDAGLTHLRGLKKLSYVGLARTHVTDAGVEALKQALPGLDTYHGP
jgi:DNA-binding transcriptional ArsR family regulator